MLAPQQLQRILRGRACSPCRDSTGASKRRHRIQSRLRQRFAVQLGLAARGGKAVGKRQIRALVRSRAQPAAAIQCSRSSASRVMPARNSCLRIDAQRIVDQLIVGGAQTLVVQAHPRRQPPEHLRVAARLAQRLQRLLGELQRKMPVARSPAPSAPERWSPATRCPHSRSCR